MSLPINSLYSLTWGDYGTSLVSAVQLLRCHGDLVDCTLAAGGRSFPAHKIVLCAASPFLLDLLKNTPCKHPVVMLAGVNANDLEALLEFVYRGEVSVEHSQLPSLLQAAHCLNIQGLAPQTVSKDDYSIQLHPTLVPQHHVKAVIDVGNNTMVMHNVNNDLTFQNNEDLIATIQTGHNQTVQAQVVEQIPDEMSGGDVKDVLNQLLPNRKRKPKPKKSPTAKIAKRNSSTSTVSAHSELNGNEEGKSVVSKPRPGPDGVSPSKAKPRSQSEQPASCPICAAVIRQSRNLRRHLELRHFSKPGGKKEKKGTNQTVTIKKEMPDDIASTSTGQTISVSVAQPQQTQALIQDTLQGHQITLSDLNQATIQVRNSEDGIETGLITTHEPQLRPHTELFRVGAVYTIEERRIDNNKLT